MSLVAYDNSDSSEYEDDDHESSPVILHKTVEVIKTGPSSSQCEKNEKHESESDGSLFNALPQPMNLLTSVVEEEDEFLHKKEPIINVVKPKSKITVPSLSDFKDVETTVPSTKPRAANGQKSGLLSILPQPKNERITITTKSLIPHVLTKKTGSSSIKKKESLTPSKKKANVDLNKLIKDYSDESDNDEEVQNDFFSINKPIDLEEVLPLDIEQSTQEELKSEASSKKEPRSIESYFKKDVVDHVNLEPDHPEQEIHGYTEVETANSGAGSVNALDTATEDNGLLDDEAILKLAGARGKRKREEIQIIDVNQQEVLAEARQWLLKGLMDDTSKRVSASKKRGNEPTNMQKRKHQITYLAHQAKANEVELQNKWANNRMSKRQTQSKYGF